MNLLFTYIVTGLLVAMGLLSLGNDFPFTPLYIILALAGLALSFWQQKKQPLPYLRAVANVILLALTVKALYPFFVGKPRYDMFTALIATWIYFLILSTYIIRTKRDYYIIQGLSLGLIVYACFYATHNPLRLLGYTTAFLVLWIMALRNANLFPEAKEKTIFYTTRDIWREIKLGAILFFAIVIISLPFYFLLPRFNIPLLPMDQLLRQRYSAIYADFPKRGLVIFLSRNPRDIMTEKKEGEGETPSLTRQPTTQSQIELTAQTTKPILWHAKEDIEKFRKQIKENEEKLENIAKKNNADALKKDIQQRQKLRQQEEKLNQQKKELQKALQKAREELQKQQAATAAAAKAAAATNLKEAEQKALQKALEEAQKQQAAAASALKQAEDKIKEVEAQLQKVEQEKQQIRESVSQQAVALNNPEIRQLWDKNEEKEKQIKELTEQLQDLTQEQQPKPAEEQAKATEQQAKVPEEKPKNQEAIDKLEQKIEKTNQELKDLAQQNNLPDVEKNTQEYQKLVTQEEKINQEKKELEKTLQKAREDYVKMAEIQSNPNQELAANPAALKELQDKMTNAENKIQNMGGQHRAMDKQLDKIREAIDKIRDSVYRQSAQSTQKIRIAWDKKEEQQNELKKLKEGKSTSGSEEETAASVGEGGEGTSGQGIGSGESMENEDSNMQGKGPKTKKPGTVKTARQITILDVILYILIIITLSYVIRSIVSFIFPYIKHKRRILHASHQRQYNLSIALIYNFLGRVLYIFGYKYPVVMLPEEYLKAMNKRFAAISHYTQDLTNLFIEARYSSHRLNADQEKQAFENYRNILQELKNSGAAWQRHILKMWFLFEI